MRGGRPMREDMNHPLAFFDAAAGREMNAENSLCSDVMQRRAEDEAARALIDRPAGEHPRKLRDVLLRVSAVDAECVELHDFASVVFVEAATLLILILVLLNRLALHESEKSSALDKLRAHVRPVFRSGNRARVVEIEQHR